jgi:hypothetical protein
MIKSDNWPSYYDASDSGSCHILTSDSDDSPLTAPVSKSRLRPAGKAPAHVPPAAEDLDTSDEEEPELTIPYNVEWKLSINNRRRAGQSELGIVEPPREFWRHVLEPKLAKEIAKKPCQANETKIVLSTTRRSTPPITRSFEELDVDWSFVKKQLQKWKKLPNKSKSRNVTTVTITFYYTYVDANKPTKAAATAEQQGEIEARIGDGTVLSRGACIRKAYLLMRCPGLPCTKGDHCWQYEGKHRPLHPHHIRMLADHLQAGKPLNGHDDVPETFRRLVLDDERDREAREEEEREKQRRRKRRRRDSDGSMTIHCHSQQCALGGRAATPELIFPTSPLMGFDEPREDLVRAYSAWQRSHVSEEQEGFYEQIQHLTLHHGIDLDMIVSNQKMMFQFYMKHEVPKGFAWRYVSDIRSFHKLRQQAKNAR